MFDFSSLKKSVQSIGGKVAELRAAIEEKKRLREEIVAAPLAREDVVQLVDALFQRAREDFPRRLAESLFNRITNCDIGIPADVTAIRQNLSLRVAGLHSHPGNFQPEAVDLELGLLALLGESLRGPLVEVIAKMPWPAEPGLPMAKRKAELAKLDNEIAKLESELSTIENEARAAGIAV